MGRILEMLASLTKVAPKEVKQLPLPEEVKSPHCHYYDPNSSTKYCQAKVDVVIDDPRVLCAMHKNLLPIPIWHQIMAAK